MAKNIDVEAAMMEYENRLVAINEENGKDNFEIEQLKQKIQQREVEATECRNMIAACKKLMGAPQNAVDITVVAVPLRTRSKLHVSILPIIDTDPQKNYDAGTITEILKQQGVPTQAEDFTTVVRNSLNRMVDAGVIMSAKEGHFIKYYSKKRTVRPMFEVAGN